MSLMNFTLSTLCTYIRSSAESIYSATIASSLLEVSGLTQYLKRVPTSAFSLSKAPTSTFNIKIKNVLRQDAGV